MNTSQRVRLAGTAYAVGGLLWFMVMTGLTMVFGGDPPPGSAAFLASETIYSIVQALLLFGFFGIYWGGGVGQGVFGKIAFGLGALGHLVFLAGEIHSLVAGTLSDLVPLGALVSAIGILVTGIAVVAAKQWRGWARWIPLLTGLYPWLVMFPLLFISGEPNSYTIAGWGLLRLALGLAIRAQADAVPDAASPADVQLSQRSV